MKLLELVGAEEGVDVEAVVGAEAEAVQQVAPVVQLAGQLQGALQPAGGHVLELFRLLVHHGGELHHVVAVGDGPGGVTVHHQVVLIAALFADLLQEALGVLRVPGVGVDEDGAVAVALGGLDVDVGHVGDLQFALVFAHLVPLGVDPVVGVHLAEGLHGEEEHQLEGGHLAADGRRSAGS